MKTDKKTFIVFQGEEITDPDIKAVYLITEALRISTPRMRKVNLDFALSKYHFKVENK
jgi:hypothetical protein